MDNNKIFIDVDEIDTMNLRNLHDLTSTRFNTIQFLQHLKLLPTKPWTGESCPKNATTGISPTLKIEEMKVCFYRKKRQ